MNNQQSKNQIDSRSHYERHSDRHPTLRDSLSCAGGAYEFATFKKLAGRPNWTMEWPTDDRMAKPLLKDFFDQLKPKLSWNKMVN